MSTCLSICVQAQIQHLQSKSKLGHACSRYTRGRHSRASIHEAIHPSIYLLTQHIYIHTYVCIYILYIYIHTYILTQGKRISVCMHACIHVCMEASSLQVGWLGVPCPEGEVSLGEPLGQHGPPRSPRALHEGRPDDERVSSYQMCQCIPT